MTWAVHTWRTLCSSTYYYSLPLTSFSSQFSVLILYIDSVSSQSLWFLLWVHLYTALINCSVVSHQHFALPSPIFASFDLQQFQQYQFAPHVPMTSWTAAYLQVWSIIIMNLSSMRIISCHCCILEINLHNNYFLNWIIHSFISRFCSAGAQNAVHEKKKIRTDGMIMECFLHSPWMQLCHIRCSQ